MAEFGDALSTAIISQSDTKPSMFEVLAQENLRSAIRPAVGHVIKVLAENYPVQLGWCQRWFHEFYTIFESAVQHHFLSTYSASYAEYYYGLKRFPQNKAIKSSATVPLGKQLHILSIATLSVFPYMQVKLNERFGSIKEQYLLQGPKGLSSTERAFLHCYPYVHLLWNFTILYCNFLYAIGESDYHSPLYSALKIKLQYENSLFAADSSSTSWFSRHLTKLLTGGVYAGVFVIQFMKWWFDEENQNSVKEVMKNPTPEAPSDLPSKTNIPVPPNEICPLCNRRRKNDTALMTSGYVYCYVCIFKYVKAHGRCPVTGYRSGTQHLVKIYPPV